MLALYGIYGLNLFSKDAYLFVVIQLNTIHTHTHTYTHDRYIFIKNLKHINYIKSFTKTFLYIDYIFLLIEITYIIIVRN